MRKLAPATLTLQGHDRDLTTPLVLAVVDVEDEAGGVRLACRAALAEAEGAGLLSLRSARPLAPQGAAAHVREVVEAVGIPVGIETSDAEVAAAALTAGAVMVHDRSGDAPDVLLATLAAHHATLVVTHAGPGPGVPAVVRGLANQIERAGQAGVEPRRLAVDPGLDLGKDATQVAALLQRSPSVTRLDRPVVASLTRVGPHEAVALAAVAVAGGWRLVRTRHVRALHRACSVLSAILSAP